MYYCSNKGTSPAKNVTKTVGRGGAITLKTKNKIQATLTGVARTSAKAGQAGAAPGARRGQTTSSAASRKRPTAAGSSRSLTRTIKGTSICQALYLRQTLLSLCPC